MRRKTINLFSDKMEMKLFHTHKKNADSHFKWHNSRNAQMLISRTTFKEAQDKKHKKMNSYDTIRVRFFSP